MKVKKVIFMGTMTLFLASVLCMGCKSSKGGAVTKTESAPAPEATGFIPDTDYDTCFKKDMSQYNKRSSNPGTVKSITYYSEVMGADRNAQIYIPAGYDSSKTYPVMYLIHGIGCDSNQWVSMGAANVFDTMIDSGKLKPFICVFPSVIPKDGLDKNTFSDTNINAFKSFLKEYTDDLEPYLVKNFNITTKREDTAVAGLSMGGMEALRLGFTYLDKFNYIGSFSAAPTLEVELLTTEGSAYIPEMILVCSGDADSTVGDTPYSYHRKMQRNGVKHLWYSHPGGGHSGDVWMQGLVNVLERLGSGFVQ